VIGQLDQSEPSGRPAPSWAAAVWPGKGAKETTGMEPNLPEVPRQIRCPESAMAVASPLDRLREDHAAAIEAVRDLADLAGALSASAPTPWSDSGERLSGALEKARDILLLHFRLEEEALFPEARAIISAGAPAVDILTQFLDGQADDDLTAHFLMRSRLRELASALDAGRQVGELDADEVGVIHTNTNLLADTLRRHAEKEHRLIFPMIERMLDEAQMKEVAERMAHIHRLG